MFGPAAPILLGVAICVVVALEFLRPPRPKGPRLA